MNIEQLIEYITAEVLKRVQVATSDKEQCIDRCVKEKMLIIGEDEKLLAHCQKTLESEYDITISSQYDNNGKYSHIILANLDIDLLASAAVGLLESKYKVIQDAIMQGKPIYIIDEGILYRKYQQTCNHNFYKLLIAYEEQVESFGMQIISIDHIDRLMTKQPDVVIETLCTLKESPKGYKLITEQILKDELDKGNKVIRIMTKALVTPLALDYARQQNMTIIRTRKEECQ